MYQLNYAFHQGIFAITSVTTCRWLVTRPPVLAVSTSGRLRQDVLAVRGQRTSQHAAWVRTASCGTKMFTLVFQHSFTRILRMAPMSALHLKLYCFSHRLSRSHYLFWYRFCISVYTSMSLCLSPPQSPLSLFLYILFCFMFLYLSLSISICFPLFLYLYLFLCS